ncbi:TPA: hypothetical protein OL910_001259 [Klebsiella pneumoniae]|uniref:hypothetical protein n=1 Tax=Klebsiella TaxID=570 RepID=UPI001143E42A|nr:hypothetical protein [Klebsiella pneumoniae]EKQ6495950.1 hypothetical protein [Klebsiella pneumoniae]MCE0033086.1 hypothetical protein [Klebsiella pneumoniae]MEA4436059.1 hypothetical protein [Klebsiella pneumoniae]TYY52935.1 hypothetical protein FCH00_004790 [Klebsiella pneumoniae]HBQ7652703.1 hypothetical protein [Klebsiella pneumoniae]
MEKEILTAFISAGASFVGAGIGWIVAYKTVKAQVNQSVKNLAASHRAEIIRRQLDSLETLWGIFDATSRTGGQGRIIQHREGNIYLSIPNTKKFINLIEKTFNGKSGLYFSEICRRKLFDFRNYLLSFINTTPYGVPLITLSSHQFDEFYNKRKKLRHQIRTEMGSLDLRMAKEELDKLSKDNFNK